MNFLHRCDRAVIYIFIAGSYFPWLTIHALKTNMASGMKLYVWVLALLGIIYQQVFHEKYKTLEIVFYFAMGFVPAVAICMGVSFHTKIIHNYIILSPYEKTVQFQNFIYILLKNLLIHTR